MGIWGKIGKVLGKVGETYLDVGALVSDVQLLEMDILRLRGVVPEAELRAILARLDRIKAAAKAVVR